MYIQWKEATGTLGIMSNKILSQAPTELELQFAKAFADLENSSPELKAELRPLQFKSVREVCLFVMKIQVDRFKRNNYI